MRRVVVSATNKSRTSTCPTMVGILVAVHAVSLVTSGSSLLSFRLMTRRGTFRRFSSVTGTIYTTDDENAPTVTLFTKSGCTLCDKVKDVLTLVKEEYPHSLTAVDITDPDRTVYWDKYKYDIPVLHMEQMYWTKHRITKEEAAQGFDSYRDVSFESPMGEPNAAKYESS